jgi:hypothetical protein
MTREIVQEWPSQDWLLRKGPIREFHPSNTSAPETERSKNWKRVVKACEKHIENLRKKESDTGSVLVELSPDESAENLALLGVTKGKGYVLEVQETPNSLETAFVVYPWHSEMNEPRFRVQRWDNVTLRQLAGDRMLFAFPEHNLSNLELDTLAGILERGFIPDNSGERQDLKLDKGRGFFSSFRNVLKVPFSRR